MIERPNLDRMEREMDEIKRRIEKLERETGVHSKPAPLPAAPWVISGDFEWSINPIDFKAKPHGA